MATIEQVATQLQHDVITFKAQVLDKLDLQKLSLALRTMDGP